MACLTRRNIVLSSRCNLHVTRTLYYAECLETRLASFRASVHVNETHTEEDSSVGEVWSSAGCRRDRCCCPPHPENIGPRSPSSACARSPVWSKRPENVCRFASSISTGVAGSSPRFPCGGTCSTTGLLDRHLSFDDSLSRVILDRLDGSIN